MEEDNNGNIESQDRLTSLPDSIIITILSLLPIDSAAVTSTLSRRWNHLWTHITHLNIDGDIFTSPEQAFTTVTHILRQVTSPKIHTFRFFFDNNITEDNEDDDIVPSRSFDYSGIIECCDRNIENFEFIILDIWPLIKLPGEILRTGTLINLKLHGSIECDLPDCGNIYLPNLKKLRLSKLHLKIDFLNELIKSCPVLECLSISLDMSHDIGLVSIISSYLKVLDIHLYAANQVFGFLIDTPKLEYVGLKGCFTIYNFLKKSRRLLKAEFGFWEECVSDKFDLRKVITCLMENISNVKSITLFNNFAGFNPFDYVDKSVFKVFRKLTTLVLRNNSGEKVNCSLRIPICWLTTVKRIEMYRMEVGEKDIELVEYVLRNAGVLEELYVHLTYVNVCEGVEHPLDEVSREKDRVWREYTFCKSVFALSRKSSACLIEFDGYYIQCKGNDFENGSLACRIK